MRKLRTGLVLALGIALLGIAPMVLSTRTALAQTATCFGQPANGNVGTGGNDVLIGNDNPNLIDGKGGNDTLCGLGGGDTIGGRSGNDRIDGGAGDDVLRGQDGRDLIIGGTGSDKINSGAGDDVIRAADGEVDTIDCGLGTDTVEADRIDRIARNCENVSFVP